MSASASDQPVIDAPLASPVVDPVEEAPREERARLSGYKRRFAGVYLALALVAGMGLGALVVLAAFGGDDAKPAPRANAIQPAEEGELGAIALAEAVQRNYRLPTGQELVSVIASRNTLQDGNLGYLRVRFQVIRPADATFAKDSKLIELDNAMQFSLCGSAPACAIPGQASAERGVLVRRMGLELAVRMMKLDSSVQNVSVFLRPIPPPQGTDGYVLVFRRNALERSLLTTPIEETLPGAGKRVSVGQMTPTQIQRIDQLTRRNLYVGVYQLIGGRDAVLQLQPAEG